MDESNAQESKATLDRDDGGEVCDPDQLRSAQRARDLKRHSKALGGVKLSAEYQRLLDDEDNDRTRTKDKGKGKSQSKTKDNDNDDNDNDDNDNDDNEDDDGKTRTTYSLRAGKNVLSKLSGEETIDEDVDDEELDKLEAFNLDQERSDGYFDDSGNYVRYEMEKRTVDYDEYGRLRTKRKSERRFGIGASAEDLEGLSDGDGDDVQDAWMDELEKTIAKDEMKKQKKRRGSSMEEDEANAQELLKKEELERKEEEKAKVPLKVHLQSIVDILESGETVLKALKRLKPPPSTRPKRKAGEVKNPLVEGESATAPEAVQVTPFSLLTEAADNALYAGKHNIYELTREAISKLIDSENPSKVAKKWLYKWSSDAPQIYGPYSFEDMKAWWDQGHFTPETGLLVKEDRTTKNYIVLKDISQLSS